MSIFARIQNLLFPEMSELQKLELRYKKLCQQRIALKNNGRVIVSVEVEIDRVVQCMNLIQKQRNQEKQNDYQLLQEAYAELDEEFPNIRSLLNRDRRIARRK